MTAIREEGLPVSPSSDRAMRVRQEVWQSLISMLRVYAHAASLRHSLNDREVTVIETAPNAALLEHQGHTLRLRFDARSGRGSFDPDAKGLQGGFTILEDGALRLDGEEKQLDEAAIDWVEQLTRTAAGEEGR